MEITLAEGKLFLQAVENMTLSLPVKVSDVLNNTIKTENLSLPKEIKDLYDKVKDFVEKPDTVTAA